MNTDGGERCNHDCTIPCPHCVKSEQPLYWAPSTLSRASAATNENDVFERDIKRPQKRPQRSVWSVPRRESSLDSLSFVIL
jgi:hypothetical protein